MGNAKNEVPQPAPFPSSCMARFCAVLRRFVLGSVCYMQHARCKTDHGTRDVQGNSLEVFHFYPQKPKKNKKQFDSVFIEGGFK
jgi:hypothetical protein